MLDWLVSARPAMDKYIKHFCDELGIGRKSNKKLEDHGILTLADLMKVPERIQKRELNGIREDVREKLVFAAEWKLSHPDADFVEDFSEDYYEEWYNAKMRGRIAEKYIKRELGQPYRAENVDLYTDIDADPVLLDAVVSESKSIIMQSSKLQEACGKFDYDSFLDKAIRHFHAVVGQESGVPEKQFIVAGRTQAGKTSVKGVIQSLCGLLNIPLVILTKGVDESIDLHAKLVVLAEGTQVEEKHVVVGKFWQRYSIYLATEISRSFYISTRYKQHRASMMACITASRTSGYKKRWKGVHTGDL